MRKRIYVAGPLTADHPVDYLRNCRRMMQLAEELRQMGYAPYVPCLDLLMGLQFGYDRVEDYQDVTLAWVTAADGVMLLPRWERSKGTKREIMEALEAKVPVFETLTALDNYFKEQK